MDTSLIHTTTFADDAQLVRDLGDEIGWGSLMEIASGWWALRCEDDGISTEGTYIPTTRAMTPEDLRSERKDQATFVAALREIFEDAEDQSL